jgi:hypothetical protein
MAKRKLETDELRRQARYNRQVSRILVRGKGLIASSRWWTT